MKQKSWKQLSLVPNKTAEKPVPMTSFVLGSWWNTEQSMNCSWGVSKTSWCSRRTNCGLCWLRRASSLGVSGGLLVQHWLDVAEQRGEKLRHSLIAWKRQGVSDHHRVCIFMCASVRLQYLGRCWCRWQWGCACVCWWWRPRRTGPCPAALGALWPGRPRPQSWEEAGRASAHPAWRKGGERRISTQMGAFDWTIYKPRVHLIWCHSAAASWSSLR